jgi:hypothetical protein
VYVFTLCEEPQVTETVDEISAARKVFDANCPALPPRPIDDVVPESPSSPPPHIVTSIQTALAGFVQVPLDVKSCVLTVSVPPPPTSTPPAVEPSPMYIFFVSVV